MFIPMIFIKIVFSVLFAFLTVRLYLVALHGRATTRSRGKGPSLDSHQHSVRLVFFYLALVVSSIEAIVSLNEGIRNDSLRWLHFSFVGPFAALLIIQWRLGLRIKSKEASPLAKKWHHRIGYACLSVYVPMLITGLIMLWRMKNH